MKIAITAENLNTIATRTAASVNDLGFSKNGKGMVASQALRVMSAVAGYREEHAFVAALKAEKPAQADERGAKALSLLGELTNYLVRNYGDDQWDDSTRELLEDSAALLGWEPIQWALDDADADEVTPSAETAKALLLGKLGYTFSPDVDQPGLWIWRNEAEGCESSFESLDAALDDVWQEVVREVIANHNQDATEAQLTLEQWDSLGLSWQLSFIEQALLSAESAPAAASDPRWGSEHPWYGLDEWCEDVAHGITKANYWEWVQRCIEANGGEEAHCTECGKPSDDGEGYDGLCGDCADKAEAEEELEAAQALGVDLDDVKFWVKAHYGKVFEHASDTQRTEWMHAYRACNGLTPGAAVKPSEADTGRIRLAADKAFEYHDFGEDFCVVDFNGWIWEGNSTLTRVVFLENRYTLNASSKKVTFTVNVVNDQVVSAFVTE